jgi:hypothetical protein
MKEQSFSKSSKGLKDIVNEARSIAVNDENEYQKSSILTPST